MGLIVYLFCRLASDCLAEHRSDSHILLGIKVVIAVVIASHLLDQTGGISLPILFRKKAYSGVFPEEVVLEHLLAQVLSLIWWEKNS